MMPFAENYSYAELLGTVFIYSPPGEPMPVSLRRLYRAIEADGIFREISRTAVWFTYRNHKTLLKQWN